MTKDTTIKPDLPEGWDAEKARILQLNFHNGRHYKEGALVLISDEELPEFNASPDIMVIEPSTAELLDRSNVTGPY